MSQCEACDSLLADRLRIRKVRDEAESVYWRLRSSGLPIDYRDRKRTLDDLPESTAQERALCHMLGSQDQVRGMYISGPAGAYKTSVAAAYLAHAIRAGAIGWYVSVFDLMSDIHASYRQDDRGGVSRTALVDRCVTTQALVLDDLGKEKASEHGAGVIYEILDGRYRTWRPGRWMIVTSNVGLDDLCDRFPSEWGDPIRRRLSEMTVSVEMLA